MGGRENIRLGQEKLTTTGLHLHVGCNTDTRDTNSSVGARAQGRGEGREVTEDLTLGSGHTVQ